MDNSTAKPNIVFVLSDQQRWDTLGCYGQKLPITPHLDSMAADGVRFEYAFSPQPICGPARSCLQTGRYATETGCFRNHIALPENERTVASWLSEAGYETGYIGKWHLASTAPLGSSTIGPEADYFAKPVPPQRRGGYKDYWLAADTLEMTSHGYDGHLFDANMDQVDFRGYRVDCITDFAIEYLRSRRDQRPFFLYLSYIEPHQQNDRNRFEPPEGTRQRFENYDVPGDLIDMQGDWQEHFPDYLACCQSLDFNVNRIRNEIRTLGLEEDTVIFYTSDHGCHFRTRNSEYKRSCHEGSIRVPMLACGPGFTGGNTVQELVSLIDVAPTLLACAGVEKPATMRGRPLQQLMTHARDWPQDVFIQISETQIGRAVRTNKWKYSVQSPHGNPVNDPAGQMYIEDCLYDLENDPHEKRNLVCEPTHAGIRRELAELLTQRMQQAGERRPEIQARIPRLIHDFGPTRVLTTK